MIGLGNFSYPRTLRRSSTVALTLSPMFFSKFAKFRVNSEKLVSYVVNS